MQMYFLYGDPKEVAKVIQENRIRIERGSVVIEPAQPEPVTEKRSDYFDLVEIAGELAAVAVERGAAIPEEIACRLSEYGVTVPTVVERSPTVVPAMVEPQADTKDVPMEDLTEVNLDDIKDVEESDTKEIPEPTPKKTRTKKSA